MFYLINFFKTIWDLKLRGLAFIGLTYALTLLVSEMPNWKKYFLRQTSIQLNPYFTAMVRGNIDVGPVARKLGGLPGVERVEVINPEDVAAKIKAEIEDMDPEILKEVFAETYQNLKIELTPGVSERGQGLIREYLSRLLGDKKVEVTKMVIPNLGRQSRKSLREFMLNGGEYYLVTLAILIWAFSCYTLLVQLRQRSFLIQKFQRKNMVALKSYIIGIIFLLSPLLFMGVIYGYGFHLQILGLVVIFSFGAVLSSDRIQLKRL